MAKALEALQKKCWNSARLLSRQEVERSRWVGRRWPLMLSLHSSASFQLSFLFLRVKRPALIVNSPAPPTQTSSDDQGTDCKVRCRCDRRLQPTVVRLVLRTSRKLTYHAKSQ